MTCVVRSCPTGLGSPVFAKLEAELAQAVMSLPASKVPGAQFRIHAWVIEFRLPTTGPVEVDGCEA